MLDDKKEFEKDLRAEIMMEHPGPNSHNFLMDSIGILVNPWGREEDGLATNEECSLFCDLLVAELFPESESVLYSPEEPGNGDHSIEEAAGPCPMGN